MALHEDINYCVQVLDIIIVSVLILVCGIGGAMSTSNNLYYNMFDHDWRLRQWSSSGLTLAWA